MRKKVVLFDIDGTLVKTGGSGIRALNRAIMEMGGKDSACDFFELQGSTDNANFTNAFICAFGRKPTRKELSCLQEKYLKFLSEEMSLAVSEKRYEKIKGVEKFLKILSKREDVLIGLGTGNIREGAYLKLAPSGLSRYFMFGGFGADSLYRKDVLLKAVERAEKILKSKVKSGQVYVIGDTEKDVEAAKSCGYHVGIVLDGFGNRKKISMNEPEIKEKDFSQLAGWLIWLGVRKDPKGVKRGAYICPDTPIEHAYYGMTGSGVFLSARDFKTMEKVIKKTKSKG